MERHGEQHNVVHICLHENEWGQMQQWREGVKAQLDRIELAVGKTNGRVRALEKWRIGLMAAVVTLAASNGGPLISAVVKFLKL